MKLTILNPKNPEQDFPPSDKALAEPEGLLAIGGCLSEKRLLNAYRHGIFPWYNPGEPILWWSPDPRLVLFPEHVVISRSLRKTIRKSVFKVTFDQAFSDVINACANTRSEGTWISEDIKQAYTRLYASGSAHSIEAWQGDQLVGGLYGVAMGQVFFGESMFHYQTDASKVAFITMVQWLKAWGYQLIDCQVHTDHLVSLGAENISRQRFLSLLDFHYQAPVHELAWHTT